MSPPISKEWWVAAALTGAATTPALGQAQQQLASIDRRQIGVITSVQPGAAGQPGRVQSAPLVADGTRDQRIVNETDSPMHVMFADQSAITIGPKSAVTLKDFNYNAEQKTGNIAIELTKGVMRMVGGLITKRNPAIVTTKTATIGIRGGIGIISADDDKTQAAFLYGDAMEVTPLRAPKAVSDAGTPLAGFDDPPAEEHKGEGAGGDFVGNTITITQPGFVATVTVTNPGLVELIKLNPGMLAQFTAALSAAITQVRPPAPGTPSTPVQTIVPLAIPVPFAGAIPIPIPVTISVRQITGSTTTGS